VKRLMASEWRKVTTTKMLWVLALVAVAYSSVNVITLVLVASGTIPGVPETGEPSLLLQPEYITTLLAQVGTAATFVLILGIIASTFLATPRRGRVLTAKMALYAALGAAIAIVTMAVVTAVAVVVLTRFDHAPVTAAMVGQVLLGALIGLTLYAVVGVSLGALIRSQIAAIIIALVWVLLLEALVGFAFPSVGKWLPGGALNAAMSVTVATDPTGGLTQADRLPAWGGAVVLLGYALVFAVLASRTTLRRDIT
jgi:hypothetical protein